MATPASNKSYGCDAQHQYNPNKFVALLSNPASIKTNPASYVVAHRGVWGKVDGKLVPENSIAAIKVAGAKGLEAIELDVHNSADYRKDKASPKSLVLMHDYTTGRVANPNWKSVANGINSDRFDKAKFKWKDNMPVSAMSTADLQKLNLVAFDRAQNELLGDFSDQQLDYAVGKFVPCTGKDTRVATLLDALKLIRSDYPGMTVFLDLRHEDEVKAAMDTIDALDAEGLTAAGYSAWQWIILKPFVNVFPDGWWNAANPNSPTPAPRSVMKIFGDRATRYRWVPCFAQRLMKEGTAGKDSLLVDLKSSLVRPAGSQILHLGPDQSQVAVSTTKYWQDWKSHATFDKLAKYRAQSGTTPPVNGRGGMVGIEMNWSGSNANDEFLKAYRDAITPVQGFSGFVNMSSWRPCDVRRVTKTNQELDKWAGYNWKDDGLGLYPAKTTPYEKKLADARLVIVEDYAVYSTYQQTFGSLRSNRLKDICDLLLH